MSRPRKPKRKDRKHSPLSVRLSFEELALAPVEGLEGLLRFLKIKVKPQDPEESYPQYKVRLIRAIERWEKQYAQGARPT